MGDAKQTCWESTGHQSAMLPESATVTMRAESDTRSGSRQPCRGFHGTAIPRPAGWRSPAGLTPRSATATLPRMVAVPERQRHERVSTGRAAECAVLRRDGASCGSAIGGSGNAGQHGVRRHGLLGLHHRYGNSPQTARPGNPVGLGTGHSADAGPASTSAASASASRRSSTHTGRLGRNRPSLRRAMSGDPGRRKRWDDHRHHLGYCEEKPGDVGDSQG